MQSNLIKHLVCSSPDHSLRIVDERVGFLQSDMKLIKIIIAKFVPLWRWKIGSLCVRILIFRNRAKNFDDYKMEGNFLSFSCVKQDISNVSSELYMVLYFNPTNIRYFPRCPQIQCCIAILGQLVTGFIRVKLLEENTTCKAREPSVLPIT